MKSCLLRAEITKKIVIVVDVIQRRKLILILGCLCRGDSELVDHLFIPCRMVRSLQPLVLFVFLIQRGIGVPCQCDGASTCLARGQKLGRAEESK